MLEPSFLKTFNQTLIDRRLVKPDQKILLAISGGQDSMCLLYFMLQLQFQWRWKLGIVFCDHGWYTNSFKAGSFLCRISVLLHLDFFQVSSNLFVRDEISARKWRYFVLQKIAKQNNYSVIMTAHTATDRVETLLINLFRGSGSHGLTALSWKTFFYSNVFIVRPFLGITRHELTNIHRELNFFLYLDPTNDFLSIQRNKIRKNFIFYIKKFFNPQIEKNLAQFAEIVSSESEFLDSLSCCLTRKATFSKYWINKNYISSLPLALQRRVLQQILQKGLGFSSCFKHVEHLRLACIKNQFNKRFVLPHGQILFLKTHIIFIGVAR
uniref:hypothetical chloroplast RF62 n=1 Tax=Streptofilum capillatum TaxID=2058781 RepID=UPI00286B3C53|nr:hypothetical chloroplast RF62 [Streptofilum capillatum]WKT08530.1 hypothetical chloroplast RF62 [Streptofilum capillatum]